ncbi:isocitrate lyase/PEP mutase family protein [Sporolactobacillus sp. Y61]|uniref:Isocitrate lyase/PEP mutase family protein n=1 Tax=Sporolactobacillus sp. Y61 TaxID=3160863 RepID=A0AAU8IIJ7_9BACL
MDDNLSAGLKENIQTGKSLLVPGVFDGISARLAEEAGYPAALISGIGASATLLASDDYGLLSLSEQARQLRYIRQTVEFPLFVDAESGYGNALNTFYAAKELERSGAAGLILNDQSVPASSEFFQDLTVIEAGEMIGKIHAVKDALDHPDALLIARTDCLSERGWDEAIRRVELYRNAGADLVLVGGLTDQTAVARAAESCNRLPMGVTIMENQNNTFTSQELFELGFRLIFYPAVTLFAAAEAEEKALQLLKKNGYSGQSGSDILNRLSENHFQPGKKVSP